MGNDARITRKTAEDETSGSKKKPFGGKTDSSATISGSVSGETSAMRRSTRSQANSSPASSVRKSHRLDKRGPEIETTSPLRRSGRENKYQSPSSGKSPSSRMKGGSGLKNKGGSGIRTPGGSRKDNAKEVFEAGDKTLKEKHESSPKVGEKRKKRLHARQFKAMFKLPIAGARDSESKRRKLENSYCNTDSGIGDPSDGISMNCGKDVDSGQMKSKEQLQVKGDEHGDSGRGHLNKGVEENCDDDADGDGEEPVEEPQECSDRMEMEEDSATNTDGGTEGEYLDAKKDCSVKNSCEPEDGEDQPISWGQIPHSLSSTPETLAGKNNVNDVVGEDNGGVVEKPPHQEKPRLDHDSSKHESMGDTKFASVRKDRVECSDGAEKVGQITNVSDPSVDADQDSCVKCKHVGNLMRCSGKACRRSYHPSCLWTSEENAHIPIWYCSECMKKKLTLGVYSVSEGIESILDVREVELSNSKGSLGEKQYFVKYKGLAHIHNCWITETQLLSEAPDLLVKFSEQGEDKWWKPEWAVPHRLLIRRSIIVDEQDAHFTSKSHHEWLVKWHGLEYDQATWELEDSELIKKPESQQLLKEYETRHIGARSSFQKLLKEYETRQNEARNSNMSGDNKIHERKKNLHVKYGRFSDSLRMESVNKLREFNQKRHNVLLLEEEDRVMKVIYFISSILSSACRPFLIIAPCESLAFWEAEFLRFTSSINVVVYGGNIVSRKMIRSLEFYQEGGELMLQVLLSSVEDISEDLKEIKGMEWEAVIIDDCQKHSILEKSVCIKTLVTDWKLLLFNAQLKDTISEYTNILSLLEPLGSSNQYYKNLNVLRERLCSFIISPRFQEYWVPVEISNVQLEQYCSLMLSNLSVLRSSSKNDRIGSLNDILVSTQKCCDHPYLVHPLLRIQLLSEQPSQDAALDMGVKSSGKLLLLDELLSEFRNQGLKVLILFQPISGSGKDNIEIILDDFLTWRFGEDSYEHIAAGGQPSTKKAALNKFNQEKDRSFLLLETRACSPSIKLSSVDSVIILNSDWNPLNDLRALQKIIIDLKLKTIKVFRFYCSCTVEEKALIIAKNDMIPENTQQINPSTKQMLLMWGSSYLFSRLDEFHSDNVPGNGENIAFGFPFVTEVCQEIVSLVQNHGNTNSSRYISLARQDGGCYFTNTPLLGEQRTQLEEGVSSHSFWVKLLEGKNPQWKWKCFFGSNERNRKRVHYSDELSLPQNVQTGEQVKKRKDCSPRRVKQNSEMTKDRNKEFHGPPDVNDDRNYLHEQRVLFDVLKPTVSRFCEALTLKDETKRLAERFLEFVLNNHQVTREPETILQAFQISVCWAAAEVLEKKIDHGRSVDIARDKMKFKCLEQETESVYSKMKMLMKIFLARNVKTLNSLTDPAPATDDSARVLNDSCVTTPIGSIGKVSGFDESSFITNGFEKVHSQLQSTNNEKDSLGNADMLITKCEKKMKRLTEKHNNELVDFENLWEKKRVELEDTYKLELAFIRYSHANSAARADKLKILDNDYVNKRKYLEGEVSDLRKELEARQQEEREGEQKKIAQLLKLVRPMAPDEALMKPQSVDSLQGQMTGDIGPCKDSNGILSVTENLPAEHNSGEASGTQTAVMENNWSRDEPFHLSEKQRTASENLNSAESLENVLGFQVAGAVNTAGERFAELIPSCRQECVADQHCPTGGETTEVTDQMDDVVVDKQASPERDGGNDASSSFFCLSTEQLQSPAYTLMEQQIADGTSVQGFGDGLCQQVVESVDEGVGALADICSTSPGGETSLLDPANTVSSNLPREGASIIPAVDLSFPVSVGDDQIRVASCSQLNDQPNEVQAAVQNPCPQIQQDRPQLVAARTVDANIRQDTQYVSEARGASIAYASHPNPVTTVIPTISRVSSSYHSDPLQIEYERIRKEFGVILNTHEETKLRLKCECDKEIEETVAQIKKKYDVKLEEAESSFSLKRNEMETNLDMVMMNKFLADALRSKCMDYKAAATTQGGTQKGVPSDKVPQPQPKNRPFSAAGSSVIPTAFIPDNTQPPPARAINPSPMLSSRSTLARHENRAAAPHLQRISALSAASSQQTPHDNFQNHESWDISQFGRTDDLQQNQQPQPAGDVVCLSDDD
ncbi:hypothetical protein RND81_09G199800 [Saponaria officinalis]|uniref:Helicase protein MOM1 n=1 Tax=Saponaria officinalis TaxID=3572 RepID=A0AAW1IQ63_SAPOF